MKIKKTTAKKIFSVISSLVLFLGIAGLVLTVQQFAYAQTSESIGSALTKIGTTTKLPGYESGQANASIYSGASNITSAILFVVDLLKYLLGTIAVMVIIITGIKLITAGQKIDEVSKKSKETLKYAIIGLIVIMMADTMIRTVFFGQEGEVVKTVADAKLAAQRGTEQLKGLYNFIEYFLGAVAVLMVVISGARLVTAYSKTEEQITKARKQIMWAIGGLIVVGLSEFIVKDVVFPKEGTSLPDLAAASNQIVTMTNFITSFTAAIAIGFIMYGGVIYMTALGDQGKTQKGKKIIMGAVIGLIISLGAYAIINSMIPNNPQQAALAPFVPSSQQTQAGTN